MQLRDDFATHIRELNDPLERPYSKNIDTSLLESIEPPRDCRRLNILREYDNEKTNLHS